jgi:hypothetical protein
MRSWRRELLAACAVVLGVGFPCFGQTSPGPATLENLVNSPEAQGTPAVPEAAPKRPAGTVVRPKNGVQHPDLDKAWADYDAVVTKAAEGIKAAITKQFDAATEKGDLDAAEKWQAALEKFEQAGEVPSGGEAKAAVSAAVADYKRAREELSKTYESVVKALTMEKKIAEAKVARDEWKSLAAGDKPASAPLPVVIEAKTYKAPSPNAAPQRDGTPFEDKEGLTIPGVVTLQWEVRMPKAGKYFVHVLYASERHRRCNLVVDGATVVRGELGQATGGLTRRDLRWATFGPFVFKERSLLEIDPQDYGPHYDRIVVSENNVPPTQ